MDTHQSFAQECPLSQLSVLLLIHYPWLAFLASIQQRKAPKLCHRSPKTHTTPQVKFLPTQSFTVNHRDSNAFVCQFHSCWHSKPDVGQVAMCRGAKGRGGGQWEYLLRQSTLPAEIFIHNKTVFRLWKRNKLLELAEPFSLAELLLLFCCEPSGLVNSTENLLVLHFFQSNYNWNYWPNWKMN